MHTSNRFRSFSSLCVVAALAWSAPRPVRADVTAAARAFAEGQAAQLEGDHALAAERFELAFALRPSQEALRSAARMHMSAENFARAATDAQILLDRYGDDAESAELARSILEEVRPRVAGYDVSCTPECSLTVDGLAYFLRPARRHRLYLAPGRTSLEARFASGRATSRAVTTNAGETARVGLAEPPALAPPSGARVGVPGLSPSPSGPERTPANGPAAAAASEARGGLPLVLPLITGAATVACGAVTIWAAVDTRRQHHEYVDHPTDARWNDGVSRQKLTNVLAASTAVLGAATITLAFFVRSSSEANVEVTPTLSPTSASLALAKRF